MPRQLPARLFALLLLAFASLAHAEISIGGGSGGGGGGSGGGGSGGGGSGGSGGGGGGSGGLSGNNGNGGSSGGGGGDAGGTPAPEPGGDGNGNGDGPRVPSPVIAPLPSSFFGSSASGRDEEREREKEPEPATPAVPVVVKPVDEVLASAASSGTALIVQATRAPDQREPLLTPVQREQAVIVTVANAEGDRIKLTLSRKAAPLAANDSVGIAATPTGYNVTREGKVIGFIPKAKLLPLTGHAEHSPPAP